MYKCYYRYAVVLRNVLTLVSLKKRIILFYNYY